MPALSVAVNGQLRATVSTDGLELIMVNIHGDVVTPTCSTIDVAGGRYESGHDRVHLIWLDSAEIAAGDLIEVMFLRDGVTFPAGRTIDELYPDESTDHEPRDEDQTWREVAEQTKIRTGFRMIVDPPSGTPLETMTAADEHSFRFGVTWHYGDAGRARISLSSNSLANVIGRVAGRPLARFDTRQGERVALRIFSLPERP